MRRQLEKIDIEMAELAKHRKTMILRTAQKEFKWTKVETTCDFFFKSETRI